jgi:uracil phosphoribosyltransferase
MSIVHHIAHPLIQHKLAYIRDKRTPQKLFRELVNEVSMLMAYEITKELPTITIEVETPLSKTNGERVLGEYIVLIPILRAGLGMVDGVLQLLPTARVGHIGIFRDEDHQSKPVPYYSKMPDATPDHRFIVLDPMLATGGSAIEAIQMLKDHQVKNISYMCIIAAPEGINALMAAHQDLIVYTAAVDDKLNASNYIIPGLGDAGDRLFGTS